MRGFRIWIPVAVLSLGVVMVLARPQDSAAAKPSSSLPIGFVDVDEVAEKSVVGQAAQQKATQEKGRLQAALNREEEVAFLTAEEREELKRLEEKPDKNRSDADKARIAELQVASEKLFQELQTLQQKPMASEADKARIDELTKRVKAGQQQLATEQANAEQKLREILAGIMKELEDQIMKAVDDEAKSRNLAMVIRKEVRLVGGEDITGGVIGRLRNPKK
jgi:Skp family chaperone for outer membrane proteins